MQKTLRHGNTLALSFERLAQWEIDVRLIKDEIPMNRGSLSALFQEILCSFLFPRFVIARDMKVKD